MRGLQPTWCYTPCWLSNISYPTYLHLWNNNITLKTPKTIPCSVAYHCLSKIRGYVSLPPVIKELRMVHRHCNKPHTETCTVQLRDKHPKICVRNTCAQFAYTCRRLTVRAFPTRLISMYELACCLLRPLILLVLAAIYCKSMA